MLAVQGHRQEASGEDTASHHTLSHSYTIVSDEPTYSLTKMHDGVLFWCAAAKLLLLLAVLVLDFIVIQELVLAIVSKGYWVRESIRSKICFLNALNIYIKQKSRKIFVV